MRSKGIDGFTSGMWLLHTKKPGAFMHPALWLNPTENYDSG